MGALPSFMSLFLAADSLLASVPRNDSLPPSSIGVPERAAIAGKIQDLNQWLRASRLFDSWRNEMYEKPAPVSDRRHIFAAYRQPTDDEIAGPAFLRYEERVRAGIPHGGYAALNWELARRELQSEPVALGVVCPDTTQEIVRIEDLITDPNHRREGFGSRVLEEIVCQNSSASMLQIAVHARNKMAIIFLERFGFWRGSQDGDVVLFNKKPRRI